MITTRYKQQRLARFGTHMIIKSGTIHELALNSMKTTGRRLKQDRIIIFLNVLKVKFNNWILTVVLGIAEAHSTTSCLLL
jgi:hypothetical protein